MRAITGAVDVMRGADGEDGETAELQGTEAATDSTKLGSDAFTTKSAATGAVTDPSAEGVVDITSRCAGKHARKNN